MEADHIFIALTNPVDGKENEFNEFYDRYHVPEVISAPGWVAAQRYELSSEQRADQSPPWKYIVIYEIARPEGEILSALGDRKDLGPRAHPEQPLWKDDSQVWIYKKVGPRQVEERP
ncbi:MAG: hypothetical protein LBJ08_01960 [Bifidobacteriaceae bacterium]|jgi:hypothetical protein|nr:hypothetical protein [Bifidobacteriaceae bacterium]